MRICSIDLETTGLDVAKDRIIQLGIVEFVDGRVEKMHDMLFNPATPIPPASTAIHGILDETVRNCPVFGDMADVVYGLVRDVDLVGFNLLNFDVPLLWEEFFRAGIEWDLSGVNIIDAGVIFKKMAPRDLKAAMRHYCGKEHDGAHNAVVDAMATYDVLQGQRRAHPELAKMTNAELAKLSQFDEMPRIDLAGKLVRNADGEAVYNFAKVKGVRVKDDLGFANWMFGKDFSMNTLRHLQAEMDEIESAWALERPAADLPY